MVRRRLLVVVGVGLVAVALAYGLQVRGRGLPVPDIRPTFPFTGESSALKRTQVVATLDVPMAKGRNVVWCASFQAAWKELQHDLARGPVQLEGAGAAAEALNRSADPTGDVPAGSLCAAAGWEHKGILDEIRHEVNQSFPGSDPPTFPGITHGSFVAYARLETRVRFAIPYFQSRKPLAFAASDGTRAEVSSFGIREEDDYAYRELRKQPRVLYSNLWEMRGTPAPAGSPEFAVDLDSQSEPTQILLAMAEPKETLAATLASIEQRVAANPGQEEGGIGVNDVLLVPEMVWRITHHFVELERRPFQNPALRGQRMDVAQEDLLFRLDRSGAELRAESKEYMQPIPTRYVFDRPFLIVVRMRGETKPYFVMWVDNAELLTPMK